MSLYEKNLEFFKQYLPLDYNTIKLEESNYMSQIENNDDNLNISVENDGKICFLHSIYNIKRENLKMFEKTNKEAERLIIFGFGFGHCIDYIKENFKNLRNIVIIEPDLNVFKSIINKVDMYENIKKMGNTTFIINKHPEKVVDILFGENINSLMEKTEIVFNLSYRILYEEYYNMLTKKIVEYTRFVLVNILTDEHHLYKWSENAFKNLKHGAVLLKNFFGRFNGVPVIIVSAGPSLNYNMHYLKEVRNNAVIIAVGSAIKVLDSNGIVPHFRIAIDGNESESKIFKNLNNSNVPLIFSDDINYNILDEYKGKKIRMVLDTTHIGGYFQRNLYDCNEVVRSGFSVANVALDVASRLGSKKIIFMGQDLCYTEGSIYAKGSWNEGEKNRIDISDSKYIKTQNTLGESVYTYRPFLSMKSLFEILIKINPQIEFINSTERGLNIDGTKNKPFTEVMKEDLNKEFDIENMLLNILEQNSNEVSIVDDNWNEFRLTLNDDLKSIEKINNYRIKKLKKLDKYFESNLGINKLKTDLQYIESIETNLEEIVLYRECIKPMIFDKFKVIYMNYCYNGNNDKVLFERQLKALSAQTMELKEYLSFLLELV